MNAHGHTINCPGKPGKKECSTCIDRRMRITGHQKDKWLDDPAAAKASRFFTSLRPVWTAY